MNSLKYELVTLLTLVHFDVYVLTIAIAHGINIILNN